MSGRDPAYLQTQYELLKSRSLAERVANELNLDDDAVARGVMYGSIALDTRLRDALDTGAPPRVEGSRYAHDDD